MHRLFFVLILLIAPKAFAADVTHLYQSAKAVSSQTEAERQTVSADILRQVLLKVVGDSALLAKTDVSGILAQSNDLVMQYEYERTNVIADDLTEPDRLEVVLSFNPKAVDRLIKQVGLPIWGESRPETLIWLAVEQGDNRSVVSSDEQSDLTAALLKEVDARGLPVLLPLMDLQDQSKVTYTDISADFAQTIEEASERYGSPVTLMGLAKIDNAGNVNISWHMLINGQSDKWQSRGDMTTAIQFGIDQLANKLAHRFAQHAAKTDRVNQLDVHVTGIQSYQDYVRVVNYLKKIQYVSDVQVTNLANDSVELSINFAGDITVLNRIIAVDRILMEEPYSVADTINYRLLP